jgi:hypothetical protein
VAEEIVEVTLIGHLAEPGQGPQAFQSLASLPEGGVDGVLLRL